MTTTTMTTAVEFISAEQAKDLLENHNPQNRKLSGARVKTYADDMSNGRWSLTAQTIAIDTEGNLIDGQHRLAAVLKAGVDGCYFNVSRNATRSLDYDCGKVRTAVDGFTLAGSDIDPRILKRNPLAAIRFVLTANGRHDKKFALTNGALDAFIRSHYETLTAMVEAGVLTADSHNLLAKVPVAAALMVLCTNFSIDTVAPFAKDLRDGECRCAAQQKTIRPLRDALLKAGQMTKADQADAYKKVLTAYYHYSREDGKLVRSTKDPVYFLKDETAVVPEQLALVM